MAISKVSEKLVLAATGAVLIAFGVSGMEQAEAAQIRNATGLVSPVTRITFSEVVLPQNTAVTNQYAAFGATFANLFYSPRNGTGSPNVDANNLGSFRSGNSAFNPFSIKFLESRNEAAFALVTNPGTSTFKALLNGSVVESFTATTDFTLANNFYGFTGISFDEIQVSGSGNFALLDNLQLGAATAIPTPALLPGLVGLGVAALRKRKAEAAEQASEV